MKYGLKITAKALVVSVIAAIAAVHGWFCCGIQDAFSLECRKLLLLGCWRFCKINE